MSDLAAKIDAFERNRVCVTVTRGDEQMSQTIEGNRTYRTDAWSPINGDPSMGGRYYVLDVPNDVAEAVYAALKARFESAEASTDAASEPSSERDGAHAIYLALKERFGPEDAAPATEAEQSVKRTYTELKTRFEPEATL